MLLEAARQHNATLLVLATAANQTEEDLVDRIIQVVAGQIEMLHRPPPEAQSTYKSGKAVQTNGATSRHTEKSSLTTHEIFEARRCLPIQ